MKRIRLIAAGLCCVFLAGCSLSLTGRDVLAPPRAQGPQSELQSLIEEHAGGSYSLVYPTAGDYRNAVIDCDVDGDDIGESLALYRRRDDVTHILLIRRDGADYRIAGESSIHGAGVEKIDFDDLDGDGRSEIIIVYPDGASGLLSLTVMRADGAAQADLPAACNTFVTGCFDGDSRDILLLSLSSTIGSASAKLIRYADGQLTEKAVCEMDSQITGFEKITCGNVSEGIKGAFVDGVNSAGELTTQVLCYDPAARSLQNPLFIYAGYDSTRRTDRIPSADVDLDGLIELPICSLFDHSEDEAAETVCRRVTWNNYNPAEMALTSKKTVVLCEELGFRFTIGNSRVGSVTARYADADTMCLYAWEFRDDRMRCTDLLLTIRRRMKDALDPGALTDAVLAESETAVYTFSAPSVDSSLGYTGEEIAAGFALTELPQDD